MLYPHDIEQKLGFDRIRELLKNRCSGPGGKVNVDKIKFTSNPKLIEKLCAQTEEFMKMISSGEHIPVLNYPEIDAVLDKVKVEGIFLESNEVADVYKILLLILDWKKFFNSQQDEYLEVSALGKGLEVDQGLVKEISLKIDEKGQIKKNATPELKRISAEISKKERAARKTLVKVLRETRKNLMSPEDSSLTIRNGRLVIPLKSEHKRSLQGFIHDASASGSIIFVEPSDVLEINNDIKELSYEEKREVIRILTDLTNKIGQEKEHIAFGAKFLGIVDLIKAKATLSLEFDSIVPDRNEKGELEWNQAINPVLREALKKQNKDIVPLNIKLNRTNRILVISGPNAGGKSVCLQTVGLLQYLYQCGIPLPVQEGARIPLFKHIFIDIGDEQSIEDDLSTYSSHLKSMKYLLEHSNQGTLFLIDEFGAGTDPQFGGSIAEAILERLADSKAIGVITTHYNNLKKIADAREGLINGRMRFDVKKLQPLYQLEIGKPGSSFALEIAGKIGLPGKLIASAKRKVGTDAVELDRLLNELEQEKKHHEEQSKKFEKQNELLESTIKNYKELQLQLDIKKKEILNSAKTEAKNLLKTTNQKVENLIRQIKENKAEKVATKESREQLRKFEKKTLVEEIVEKEDRYKVIKGNIEKGDYVRIIGQQSVGEVLEIGRHDVSVLFGELKSKIKLIRLEKISRTKSKKIEKVKSAALKGIDINERKAQFSSDLDIRGKRADEALKIVAGFIDNAILFGTPSVRVIHGKGDGILREVSRNEIRSYQEVESIHDEHADRGGAGITVIEFRKD